MFDTALSSPVSRRHAAAYRQVHVSTGVDFASPHGLITMLFDGLVGAIAEARGAIRNRNVPAKGRAIGRAVQILDEGLCGSLNLADGGSLAARLHALYSYVAVRLTHANLHNDDAALEECGRLIEPLRKAWTQIADRVPA
jgi:flagellar protein FliS